jgi:pimeloyl-ACP methyl ester carboxylesterase
MKLFRNLSLVFASAAGLSWWLGRNGGALENKAGGRAETWRWRNYQINFATAGQGAPLVLLHGLYPGASNDQWQNNFDFLSKHFKVFAPDLLGFGASHRPDVKYRPALYEQFLADFLKEVVAEPATVVASGQTAPFAIDVAASEPKLIDRLILDTPTGLTRFSEPPTPAQRLFSLYLRVPIDGDLIYSFMVTKRSIREQLTAQGLADPRLITPMLVHRLWRQAHQPGAKWAPIALLGGRLNHNAQSGYANLKQPVLILWGDLPSYIPITDVRPFLDLNDRAALQIFTDCRLVPEFEQPEKFNTVLLNWIEAISQAA